METEERIDHMKQAAIAHLRSTVGDALKRDADRWNRRQSRSSLISMTMKVDSGPNSSPFRPRRSNPCRLKRRLRLGKIQDLIRSPGLLTA